MFMPQRFQLGQREMPQGLTPKVLRLANVELIGAVRCGLELGQVLSFHRGSF